MLYLGNRLETDLEAADGLGGVLVLDFEPGAAGGCGVGLVLSSHNNILQQHPYCRCNLPMNHFSFTHLVN